MSALLDRAWVAKVNQDISRFDALWAKLQALIDTDSTSFTSESLAGIEARLGPACAVGVCALQSSLFRAAQELGRAESCMKLCERIIRLHPDSARFYFEYEWGHIHVARGNFFLGLEFELEAARHATLPHQRAWALASALICAENLGLPQGRFLAELDPLLREIPAKELIISTQQQLKAYRMRRFFRHGEISALLSMSPEKPIGQEFYYRIWIRELPFHRHRGADVAQDFQEFASSPRSFAFKSYRLRTLSGELATEDLSRFTWAEFSDRIYLWTWRWLANPHQFPIIPCITLLSHIPLRGGIGHLTLEDQLMLSNVLGWLTLFDFPSKRRIRALRGFFQPKDSKEFPLLEYEAKLISAWEALIEKDSARSQRLASELQSHPFSDHPDIRLSGLIPDSEASCHPTLQCLRSALESLSSAPGPQECATTFVDLDHFRIQRGLRSRTLHSEAVVKGFELLHRRAQASVVDFARHCFDVVKFDSDSHCRRVFHLLSKMRSFAPTGLQFHLKAGTIYCSGAWDQVRFHRQAESHRSSLQHPAWSRFLSECREETLGKPGPSLKTPHELLGLSADPKELRPLTSRELFSLMRKPRSTALRTIRRWVSEGVLIRSGEGRSTRYCLAKDRDFIQLEGSPLTSR